MDSIDFAREVWREFGLNSSFGAGMASFENDVLVKAHGASTDTSKCKEFGSTFFNDPFKKAKGNK